MKNTFIFSDESGTKRQDRYFLIGFIKIVNPDRYFKTLSLYRDKLFGISRNERLKRVDHLLENNEIVQISKLAKNSFKFELKYSKINNHNSSFYKSFVKTLLDIGIELVVIGIDRNDPNFDDNAKLIASYKRIINQYLQKYGNSNEHCYIIDDFGIKIENICDSALLPDYYMRHLSESTIFLQAVDVLTGLIQFALSRNERLYSKKDTPRQESLNVIEDYFGTKIDGNITRKEGKSYLSVWLLDFSSKGHGH